MSKTISTGYISATINGIAVKSNIKSHSGNYENDAKRDVSYIVMHYTGNDNDNAENNAKYFKNNDVDVSAHFFVDETRIYQSVELRDVAWHCGGYTYYHKKCRNDNSFGIEMTTAGNYKISAKTIENSAHLCAYLCEMLGIKSSQVDTYVLRHYDVTHKSCPAQFVDNANEWKAFKTKVKNILKAKEKTPAKPTTATTAKAKFAKGDKVKIKKAVTYEGKSFAVYYDTYSVLEVDGDRVVIGINGKVTAALKDVNLTKVNKKAKTVTKGCKVKVKKGAKDYNGNSVASFVYDKVYKVDELNGKRAVLDKKGICTAFHIDNLIVQ